MEGCSKYCTFCVVPYTRGEEVSRPFADVMREVESLVAQGVGEITLLGQNVNAYCGEMDDGDTADFAFLLRAVAALEGVRRLRYTTSHPREMTQRLIDCIRDHAQAGQPSAPAGAVRFRPHPGGDEARLYRAGIQVHHPQAARGASRIFRLPPISSSAFPARPSRISRPP